MAVAQLPDMGICQPSRIESRPRATVHARILESIAATGANPRRASLTVGPGRACSNNLILLSAVLAGLVLASACGDDSTTIPPPEPDPPRATVVTVTPEAVLLVALDDTVRLSARVLDQSGLVMAAAAVTWAPIDPSVATVDGSGLVTAVGNGSATVTATSGAVSGSATVTVAQAVAEVAVEPTADTLFVGDTLRMAASATDANGHAVEGASFVWASGDTAVARVDGSGLVTGIAPGRAAVSVMSGGVTDEAQLTVVALVAAVRVTPAEASLTALGDTVRLLAGVLDESGRAVPGAEVAWASADAIVATVDSAGLVTAAGVGETKVTAAVHGVSGEARVSVTQSPHSVTVSPAADTIVHGDTLRLSAEVSDANGNPVAGSEFTWSSSDVSVATVDASGLVRGVSEGRTTITAMAGVAQGTSEITVANPDQAALVALYHATNGPDWANNENWLTDTPVGRWHGVETNDDGHVTGVSLPENLLVGTLPTELGYLTYLETLNLRENPLTGTLPPAIGNATRLREIELGHTQLDGPIPATLGRLVDLRHLNFEYAQFSGPIPPELGALTELGFLNLYQNRLSGRLPAELAGLRSLRTMYVDENRADRVHPLDVHAIARMSKRSTGAATRDFVLLERRTSRCGAAIETCRDRAATKETRTLSSVSTAQRTGRTGPAPPVGWRPRRLSSGTGSTRTRSGSLPLLDLSSNGLRGRLPHIGRGTGQTVTCFASATTPFRVRSRRPSPTSRYESSATAIRSCASPNP